MKPRSIRVSFPKDPADGVEVDAFVSLGKGATLYVHPILDPATLAAIKSAVLDAAKWALEQERKEAADEGDAS